MPRPAAGVPVFGKRPRRTEGQCPAPRLFGACARKDAADLTIMEKYENFTYELDGNLYINLTSKCTNDCTFCVRNEKSEYFGHKLWLSREPNAEDVLCRLPKDISVYKEYVFCGFGEPTMRLPVLLEIARELKKRGAVTRINTNGQANLFWKRDVTPELSGCIDKINVSLNEANAADYVRLCRPAFGEKAYDALQDFAKKCAELGIDTWFSVVDIIGEEKISICREIAKQCGVTLKVRKYIG